jgi:hypothetical protein
MSYLTKPLPRVRLVTAVHSKGNLPRTSGGYWVHWWDTLTLPGYCDIMQLDTQQVPLAEMVRVQHEIKRLQPGEWLVIEFAFLVGGAGD